ncbi:HK97 gp10 family phage protein [Rhizobium lentis]|uniref:HK97 gp10 family phage protein n=1 Tax=Rhizobium lentis TaxID=1138194 RepID=A0A9Q3MA28_9HYPH|nr:HK97 gp10 family phage protein [Rhizobium lentis]MBX5048114.1 HK97 gp10 family phage protein [Rhizobium lentis]MBX5059631.1 HK97 gp10 family phage protein [Rhizobium lentis]
MASNGLKETLAAMERVKLAAKEAAMKRLIKGANNVADVQRQLAPEDTGALAGSIAVTLPGHTTPPYSQPGGSRVVGENQVVITAGNADVRYAHLVEHGTSQAEAQPFFLPGYRLLQDKVKRSTASAYGRAARKEWNRK